MRNLPLEWSSSLAYGMTPAQSRSAGYAEATYAELERAYSAQYAGARQHFEALEEAKQGYKIARAVYEYASTPYLGVDRDSIAEEDYSLLLAVEAVDPDTRLAEVSEKHRRAEAAREAIEAIYRNNSPESLYERDKDYRDLRDAYEKQYRYLLAAKQLQVLLDKETQKAQADLADAKRVYENALDAIQNLPSDNVEIEKFINENLDKHGDQPKGILAGLSIKDGKIVWTATEGNVSIPGSVYKDIETYYVPDPAQRVRKDLEAWLKNVSQENWTTVKCAFLGNLQPRRRDDL